MSATKVECAGGRRDPANTAIMHTHADGASHSQAPLHPHRGLREIREIIHAAPIAEGARALALRAFDLLAEAEGRVHQRAPEEIHFHEVGAVDAIVDIVCAAVGANYLAADEWLCSPLNVGGGTVHCAHGTLPVPAPAVVELLKGAPVSSRARRSIGTGDADRCGHRACAGLPLQSAAAAFGHGHGLWRRLARVQGRAQRGAADHRRERGEHYSPATGNGRPAGSQLDDCTPQLVGYVARALLDAGALDVFTTPVQMKKNRPGTAAHGDRKTAGRAAAGGAALHGNHHARHPHAARVALRSGARARHGAVGSGARLRIKLARLNGQVVNAAPEFEDCRAAARGLRHAAQAGDAGGGAPLSRAVSGLAAQHRNSDHG